MARSTPFHPDLTLCGHSILEYVLHIFKQCNTTSSPVGRNGRINSRPCKHACTLSNRSEGLWEGIASKKSTCVHLKMLQNPRSKHAAWSKKHKHVLAASHFDGDLVNISFRFLWQNMLLYRNNFPKMGMLSHKLWTTKKLWQKPRERQICMETGVSVKG